MPASPPAASLTISRNGEEEKPRQRRKRKHQFAVSGGGVDGLFFKINADAQFLQLPYRFQKGHGIPGKAGYGLCDDVINFSGTTVGEHPLKVLPAVSGAGLGFVGCCTKRTNKFIANPFPPKLYLQCG